MTQVMTSRTWLSNFTFHFRALEKEMATHSSALAWRIPGTGEPSGLPSMGSHRVGHDWSDLAEAAVISSYISNIPYIFFHPVSWNLSSTPVSFGMSILFSLFFFQIFFTWPFYWICYNIATGFFFCCYFGHKACRILALWPGVEPTNPHSLHRKAKP